MLVLRFVVAGPPLPSQGRARSRGRTRVSASSPTLLPQPSTSSFVHFGCPYNHPVGIPTTPRGSPQALFRFTLPFKSHSAPRPPQTPAASSLSPYRKRLGSRSRFAPKVCPQPFPIKASDNSASDRQHQLRCAIGDQGIHNHAPIAKALASNHARRKAYESCSRTRREQFVAD